MLYVCFFLDVIMVFESPALFENSVQNEPLKLSHYIIIADIKLHKIFFMHVFSLSI